MASIAGKTAMRRGGRSTPDFNRLQIVSMRNREMPTSKIALMTDEIVCSTFSPSPGLALTHRSPTITRTAEKMLPTDSMDSAMSARLPLK